MHRSTLPLGIAILCSTAILYLAQQRATPAAPVDVRLLVSVTDKAGKPVSGLTPADFRLLEDNKPQTITAVRDATDTPLIAAVVVDNSGSGIEVTDRVTRSLAASIQLLELTMKPGRDKALLITFATTPSLRVALTDDLSQFRAVRLQFGGGTALFDALADTATYLSAQDGRRIIFLISDGEDTASRRPATALTEPIHRNDITVVGISTGQRRTQIDRGGKFLEDLTAETGGRLFDAGNLKQFSALGDTFKSQYFIQYQPGNPSGGDFRTIRINSANKDYKLTYRPKRFAGR